MVEVQEVDGDVYVNLLRPTLEARATRGGTCARARRRRATAAAAEASARAAPVLASGVSPVGSSGGRAEEEGGAVIGPW